MDLKTVMQQLESMGTAQNRKVYSRHGVSVEMFGVSYANLSKLQKAIKVDHDLALQLWETGNHDARILATQVADPALLNDKTAEGWVKVLSDYVETDAMAKLVARSPIARKKAGKWLKSNSEWIGAAGWSLVAHLALTDQSLPDDYFEPLIDRIEKTIHTRKNRVRHEMNGALIAIGLRSSRLEKRAISAARKIGKVEVDHGQTSCKTPDAIEYIRKAQAYRHKSARRPDGT